MNDFLIFICIFIWGLSTFLQKLSADKMSPVLMQVIIGLTFVAFIPFAIHMQGGLNSCKWNTTSIILSLTAAALSITGNVLMYSTLSNNKHTGSTVMMISLYPVITLLLSAIFLHEQFSIGKIIGVAVMIFGSCLLGWC